MNVLDPLRGRQGVVLDTMVFVYLFEDVPAFAAASQTLLERMSRGWFSGVVTPITAAELLVRPLREGLNDLARRYNAALDSFPHLTFAQMDRDTGRMAGALRAKYGLPLPDMFQLAVSLRYPRPALITNDKALKRVEEADVFLLGDFR